MTDEFESDEGTEWIMSDGMSPNLNFYNEPAESLMYESPTGMLTLEQLYPDKHKVVENDKSQLFFEF